MRFRGRCTTPEGDAALRKRDAPDAIPGALLTERGVVRRRGREQSDGPENDVLFSAWCDASPPSCIPSRLAGAAQSLTAAFLWAMGTIPGDPFRSTVAASQRLTGRPDVPNA